MISTITKGKRMRSRRSLISCSRKTRTIWLKRNLFLQKLPRLMTKANSTDLNLFNQQRIQIVAVMTYWAQMNRLKDSRQSINPLLKRNKTTIGDKNKRGKMDHSKMVVHLAAQLSLSLMNRMLSLANQLKEIKLHSHQTEKPMIYKCKKWALVNILIN